MPLTPEQAEERECLAEDRAKGIKEDALIEAGIVERFLRGGYQCASFPGAQLLTSDEHKVISAYIRYWRTDALNQANTEIPAWISVDERLPEKDHDVIARVTTDVSCYQVLALTELDGSLKWWETNSSCLYEGKVTHWLDGVPALPNSQKDIAQDWVNAGLGRGGFSALPNKEGK